MKAFKNAAVLTAVLILGFAACKKTYSNFIPKYKII
jgi:hypothetical protein